MSSRSPRSRLPHHLLKLTLWMMFVMATMPLWGGGVFEMVGWWHGPQVPASTSFAPVWSPENLREAASSPGRVDLDEKITSGVMVWRHASLETSARQARTDAVGEVRKSLALDDRPPSSEGKALPEFEELLRLARLDAGLKASAITPTKGRLPAPVAGQTDLMQAQASLESAVQETGLAGVWVPPSIATDAQRLQGLADNLRQANRELEQLTGWRGGVLGLAGRVVWWPVQPQLAGLGGRAWTDEAGFTHVVGSWTSLAHEWFHALDNVVAQDSYKHPVNGLGATEQMGMWWRSRRTNDVEGFSTLFTALHRVTLTQAQINGLRQEVGARVLERTQEETQLRQRGLVKRWGSTLISLGAAQQVSLKANLWPRQSPWLHWRHQAASEMMVGNPGHATWVAGISPAYLGFVGLKHPEAVYLLRANETLAYAFEGQTMLGNTPLLSSGQEDWASALLPPSLVESRLHASLFREFFASLEPWWVAAERNLQAAGTP